MRPKPPEPSQPDYAAIAEKVVGTSAKVKEGDIVEIFGGPQDLPLLEELVIAVRKRGAYPLFTFGTENILRKQIASVPEKYDTQPPKLGLAIVKIADVLIATSAVRDSSIIAALSPERQAKQAKAGQPVAEAQRKKNMRFVQLDNGLAPSAARAKEYGISEAELSKLFWDGLGADFSAVETKCNLLKTTLAAGKELKVTAANGTNLTIKLKGKKVFSTDGVIDDADIKAGGPGVQAWLPAGEVYTVPASAEGKLVDDLMTYQGKVIEGLTIDVKGGKSTSVTAKSGWDAIKARYDLASPAKNDLSVIDFGCNPAIKAVKPETFIPAGMVTIVFGGNLWAGGTNKEQFDLVIHLPGATVTLDGKPIIENGQLK